MSSPPALVTLHVWRLRPSGVPAALVRVATDRGRVRRRPGVLFAKVLGTGDGRTFTARDADLTRWALLTCWSSHDAAAEFDSSAVARGWDGAALERWRAELRPLAARGRWSGSEPFGDPRPQRWDGPVAAITRARLRTRSALSFWRAVPPVSADLHRSPGLLAAFGVGEAPLGLQGTASVWASAGALTAFAHQRAAHLDVVRRTEEERWYAEELFARFAVLRTSGTLDGQVVPA